MKRIGVIIPAITDNLQTELLDGVFKTASAADCDVIVLTTMTNALDFHIQTEIMNGEESVYCLLERAELDGVLFKVFRVEQDAASHAPAGTLLAADKKGIRIACGNGESVRIVELQAPGKKRMRAADYLLGHPMRINN